MILKSRIDDSKNVNNVSNYASTMKWSSKNDSDFQFKYPSDWKLETTDNGVERYRISGKVIGKLALENGENGDKVVESDMVIIVYEPVIFEDEDMFKVTWHDDGYNGLGAGYPDGLWWTQVALEGENVYAQDNYAFAENGGEKKLAKFRILTPNSDLSSFKEINIMNYFLGEFKI